MKNDESVQNEVRKTMDFLDKMPKLESNPFLFTRIQARLADATSGRSSQEGSRLPAVVRSALLVLLVVLNLVTIVKTTQTAATKTIDRQEVLSYMIDDYSLTGSSTSTTE
jgi:hypothetical protein